MPCDGKAAPWRRSLRLTRRCSLPFWIQRAPQTSHQAWGEALTTQLNALYAAENSTVASQRAALAALRVKLATVKSSLEKMVSLAARVAGLNKPVVR